MRREVNVKGRLSDGRHIEIDEPLNDLEGDVEVVVRPARQEPDGDGEDVFRSVGGLPPGRRSKQDIDRQIREERDGWNG